MFSRQQLIRDSRINPVITFRSKYAKENDAMLDQEQSRLTAWQMESTVYKPAWIPIVSLIAVLVLAIAGIAALYNLTAASTIN